MKWKIEENNASKGSQQVLILSQGCATKQQIVTYKGQEVNSWKASSMWEAVKWMITTRIKKSLNSESPLAPTLDTSCLS